MNSLLHLCLTSLCLAAALTPASAQIFMTSSTGDTPDMIVRADLDGSNPSILIDLRAVLGEENHVPWGIAVAGEQLYWTDSGPRDAIFTSGR